MKPTDKPQLLPRTMSDVLSLSIADARKLDPCLYIPNCAEWHTARNGPVCEVCLAGCLIAGTFQAPHNLTMFPVQLPQDALRKMEALDYMRVGKFLLAFKTFYLRWPSIPAAKMLHHLPKPIHTDFKGWPQFHKHLESLESVIDMLRMIEESDSSN